MRIVDTRGQLCPAPLIATRKALMEMTVETPVSVLTDNKTSFDNISRFLNDNKIAFTSSESEGLWTLVIRNGNKSLTKPEVEDYCSQEIPHFTRGKTVVAISGNRMGEGDNDLGDLLMLNFFKALKELEMLPDKIVFYNSGVHLGRDDSKVISYLKEIEAMGVRLYLCATCVSHYKIENEVHIGNLSNMFEIVQIMENASHVIKP